ncbi:MAG: Zn-ribbon domain-containing OB-fold protein [Ilumatobacteraceae bacterium]
MLEQLADVHPDHWTQPFWEAAARHELVCQRCSQCGTMRMPPTPFCWNCRSKECEYPVLPGTGVVFSYSTTYFTASKASVPEDQLPYTVLIVDLDGAPGCRLIGAMVPADTDPPEIGQAVRVAWEDTAAGGALPRFERV